MKSRTKILRFDGEEFFLSNFYLLEVEYDGVIYPSSEHAYQAAKTLSKSERKLILQEPYPGRAKRLGRELTLRPHWDEKKLEIMKDILQVKFSKGHVSNLWNRLLNTGELKLIEGNYWHDRYWGMHRDEDGVYRGKNHLGKLLMEIRDELRGKES